MPDYASSAGAKMNWPLAFNIVAFLASLAFGAGVWSAALRSAARDVNGLGAKHSRLRDETRLGLMTLATTEEQKRELLQIFGGAPEEKTE